MMKVLRLSPVLLLFIRAAAQSPVVPVEPGVSIRLAQERVKVVQHVRYALRFALPADVKTPVKGEETLYFNCLDNSKPLQIDFKADPSQVGEVSVNGKILPLQLVQEHLVIEARYLRMGEDSVHIWFVAGDRPLNRNKEFLYTLLVPDRARTLFPCFDQPDLKAVFTLSLTLTSAWKALANGPLGDSSVDADVKTYHFLPSDKISTYLFSFAAGNFFEATDDSMHAYYRETDTNKVRLSLDSLFRIQRQAIAFLQRYTQMPYPFQKFDFVAIPDFQFGGMEHVGAIQYQSASLFLDESATAEQYNGRSNLLSHETSHMWFGDLVTMRWFNDVWMKEVFANFMADKIGNITRPGGDFQLKFLTSHFPAAYATDRTPGANPIRQTLDNLQDAGSLYGNIIYNKAPVMMQQLERLMGETPFRDGIRQYMRTYAYGNAGWPDLIHILGHYTNNDLEAWNKVWVNEAGRPLFSYTYTTRGNAIGSLTLTQKGEDGSARVWPQFFELALVYPDHTESYTVNAKTASTIVPDISGKPIPSYLLFNSGGDGYGVFPIDTAGIGRIAGLTDPVMRASAYINQYENMLDGNTITPRRLLEQDERYLLAESKELNLSVLLGQISSVFWHFIRTGDRTALAPALEKTLWRAMEKADQPNEKKLLFLSYAGIALTREAQDNVYKAWNTKQPPPGVKLSEEDYMGLAAGLAIRTYPGYSQILQTQVSRIQNPDRKARFLYIQPSLSESQAVRDSFFASLKDRKNREKEAWVLSALSYLHHPLRTGASEKYLPASLDWLLEIQRTGDVFFPERWLQTSFGNYQTASAAAVVRRFLETHPGYNAKLKEKILQTTDNLLRAERLIRE